MNYFQASQRKDDKWDFTCSNDGRKWPVGYCSPFRDYNEKERKELLMSDAWYADHLKHKGKYHDCGHDTAEQAAECYKQYVLDHDLRLDGKDADAQRKCEVCQAWTSGFAMLDYEMWFLCDKHRTRESVEKLYKASSWMMRS